MLIKFIMIFFCLLILLSSVFVICLKNSIQAVFSLVVSFVTASLILILLDCEFFAFLFLIVYVGAIAVLFLFVIVMLELKRLDNKQPLLYDVIINVISFVIFFFIIIPYFPWEQFIFFRLPFLSTSDLIFSQSEFFCGCIEDELHDIEILGQLFYVRYAIEFLIAGLILTLAVICVGVLTIEHKNKKFWCLLNNNFNKSSGWFNKGIVKSANLLSTM